LLRSLMAAVEDRGDGGNRVTRAYHLRLDEGRQSLIFSPRDLVGLVVDPPLAFAGPQAPAIAKQPSPYIIAENFLDRALLDELLRFVAAAEPGFVDATVSTSDADYRRSKVLYNFPRFSELVRTKIASIAGDLAKRFGIAPFPVADVECQMTAHNDGNYFKLHNDSGSPDTVTRVLTYVYYFNNEPKAYSGGEFRLYHSRIEDGAYRCGEVAADITPKNNSVLFFPSYCHHEVLPVRCPTQRFADSRFTINGWIRRAA
ncbi:MAG: Prolyl 4-hydroxylase alpha subunit, partial [Rhodospirillales bacterium]|nr:Prolyl 4-hydroxylase alpha subunit [Rhodospirillales bacterium]